MEAWRGLLLVSGILRRHDKVLLVQETLGDGPGVRWGIPGGRVEGSELLHETLAREVHEETGLTVRQIGPLAFVSHHHSPDQGATTLLIAYEVVGFDGQLTPGDPDGLVQDARFFDVDECVRLLRATCVGPMRDPLTTYLMQRPPATRAMSWFWRLGESPDRPVAVIPSGPERGRA